MLIRVVLLLFNMTGVPRLLFRLMLDRRVPARLKLLLPAALVYLISPIDVVHDMVPALGRIDDLLAVVLSVGLFLALAPRKVVSEHIRGGPQEGGDDSDDDSSGSSVIDGSFRYLDDDEGRDKRG